MQRNNLKIYICIITLALLTPLIGITMINESIFETDQILIRKIPKEEISKIICSNAENMKNCELEATHKDLILKKLITAKNQIEDNSYNCTPQQANILHYNINGLIEILDCLDAKQLSVLENITQEIIRELEY